MQYVVRPLTLSPIEPYQVTIYHSITSNRFPSALQAEFLFRENPEGKMFEPEYTEALDTVLTLIEKYSDTVLHKQEISNTITQFLRRKTDVSMSLTEYSEFDVCTSPKLTTCVTSCFGDDDTDAYEKEEETVSGSTANYDQEN